jgi:hypothetical protein
MNHEIRWNQNSKHYAKDDSFQSWHLDEPMKHNQSGLLLVPRRGTWEKRRQRAPEHYFPRLSMDQNTF